MKMTVTKLVLTVQREMLKITCTRIVFTFSIKRKRRMLQQCTVVQEGVVFQDLGLPIKLSEMINAYAYTPLDERMANEIPDDDKHHNIAR